MLQLLLQLLLQLQPQQVLLTHKTLSDLST